MRGRQPGGGEEWGGGNIRFVAKISKKLHEIENILGHGATFFYPRSANAFKILKSENLSHRST